MVCVPFALLSVTLWNVYCSLCSLWLSAVCTLRCVDCESMVCVLLVVIFVNVLYVCFSQR